MRHQILQRCTDDPSFEGKMKSMFSTESIHPVDALPSCVLVTGSSGLLGQALVRALRHFGIRTVGIDIISSETTDIVASIEDQDTVLAAIEGCFGVFHTAALHAPDASEFSEEEFNQVNICGTRNVLTAAEKEGSSVVYTSTTSLMITESNKAKMEAGEVVWLDETFDGVPRNKYGRSKKAAEALCAEASVPVVTLRASRFFVEEDLVEISLSRENLRVNELLGRRVALEDLVQAHLLAMARAQELKGQMFILSAPVQISRQEAESAELLSKRFPLGPEIYQSLGWTWPPPTTRIYDSSKAVQMLKWEPSWTFEAVLQRLVERDVRACAAEF